MLHTTNTTLVQKANEFVNQVFYGTLLREFREAEEGTIFDNGPGAKTFIRQLDMELIKRMSGRKASGIAEAVARQLGKGSRTPNLTAAAVMEQSERIRLGAGEDYGQQEDG